MKQLSLVAALLLGFASFAQQNRFNQEVNYSIDVILDDVNHAIKGYESFDYTNNSPDTLTEMWIHLWPNAYKNNETAFAKQQIRTGEVEFEQATEKERGYIDSLNFSAAGKPLQWKYDSQHIDIAVIQLANPLLPGETVKISTPFYVKIPDSKFSRLGHADQQYQLCQWYPKPAVYDHKGWHAMPYLNQGEFFSEFGSFTVDIRVPKNYVIAASGELVNNPEEEKFIADRIANAQRLSKDGFPENDSFPASSPEWKTVRYRLENTHDFAWFADKRYHITTDSVVLASGKTVKTYAYFSNRDAQAWMKVTSYINDAVNSYSNWLGEYPYSVCKAVDGALSAGAGMEYPTITIIAAGGGDKSLDNVTTHEVGHNWFYGILASNERDYPWMDEGMNSFYEGRYMAEKYNGSSAISGILDGGLGKILGANNLRKEDLKNLAYQFVARRNRDQAINLASDDYTNINYGVIVYQKTAYVFNYLEAYLGRKRFDEMMHAYYETWKFRHPYPEDFKAHVQTYTGQSLDWFFDGLLESNKRVDYKIQKVSSPGLGSYIKVKNIGQIQGPVSLSGYSADTSITFWYDGFKGSQKLSFPVADFDRFSVNYTGNVLDINSKNDDVPKAGILKKAGRLMPGFFTGLESSKTPNWYVLPSVGYNYYNGFMAGMVIHNINILRKHFEFVVNPMYGFNSSSLAGSAQVDYFVRPTNAFFRDLDISASAERYALRFSPNYERITGGFTFHFINKLKDTGRKAKLQFRHVYTKTQPYLLDVNGTTTTVENNYNQVLFSFSKRHPLRPFNVMADVQQHKEFVKASVTAYYKISYGQRKKGLQIRAFAGSFLWKSATFDQVGPDARFRLSGQTGSNDYLFDDIYLGRNETSGLLSQQMTATDGAFKVYSFRGQTSDYLATINLESSLPGKIPVKVFADLGHYFNGEADIDAINYCAGASLVIIPGAFEVYFPFLISDKIKKTLELNKVNFGERIRFVVNFRLANPVTQLRTISL